MRIPRAVCRDRLWKSNGRVLVYPRCCNRTHLSGRLESARETAESAEQLARVCANNGLISVSLGLAANISVKRGDLTSARTQLEDCLTYRSVVTDRNMQLMALGLALPALVSLGHYDEAICELVETSANNGMSEIPKTQRASLYEWLVTAELAKGRIDAARQWSDLATASADEINTDLSTAAASRTAADVFAACDEWSSALSCASRAVSAAERIGRLYELSAVSAARGTHSREHGSAGIRSGEARVRTRRRLANAVRAAWCRKSGNYCANSGSTPPGLEPNEGIGMDSPAAENVRLQTSSQLV